MTYVIALPVNPALHNAIEDFLLAVAHDRDAGAAYVAYVDRLTERLLAIFMVEPAEITGLSGNARKLVDFAVSTAEKASSMLTRKIFGKRDNAEFAAIVSDLKAAYREGGGEQESLLVSEVSEKFAKDFHRVADACIAGEGDSVRSEMSAVMDKLTDEILEAFFIRSTRHVKIGAVTRKTLDLGVSGSRKAVHGVNHRVLKTMESERLKQFMQHYGNIVREL